MAKNQPQPLNLDKFATKAEKDRHRLWCEYLSRHGPIYVRAIVPDYAKREFDRGDYSAWYIGHTDPRMLDQGHIAYFVEEFKGNLREGLECFMTFLESRGYLVWHSANENGVIIVKTRKH